MDYLLITVTSEDSLRGMHLSPYGNFPFWWRVIRLRTKASTSLSRYQPSFDPIACVYASALAPQPTAVRVEDAAPNCPAAHTRRRRARKVGSSWRSTAPRGARVQRERCHANKGKQQRLRRNADSHHGGRRAAFQKGGAFQGRSERQRCERS